jgi:hypothetical protein
MEHINTLCAEFRVLWLKQVVHLVNHCTVTVIIYFAASSKPFVLTVVTDDAELTNGDAGNRGFCLIYQQIPCMWTTIPGRWTHSKLSLFTEGPCLRFCQEYYRVQSNYKQNQNMTALEDVPELVFHSSTFSKRSYSRQQHCLLYTVILPSLVYSYKCSLSFRNSSNCQC